MDLPHDGIDWFSLTVGLFGGLALFLYGMDRMGEALKAVAGQRMRSVLGALARNRFAGLVTGTFVTAVIQSSSVTTVMLVGFVAAGLMTLTQSIGVILGADIGTTITAQIVAFKVTKYALIFVSVGFVMLFAKKTRALHQYGYVVMGLGLIFFGMGIMSEAMAPLRGYEPFLSVMRDMSNPVIGILAAAAFTAVVQSSSATMGVVIVFAMQGVITLEGGIALALGANVGTCATAGLAAIGKPREAVRVAVAHVMFKVLGVIIATPFIPQLAELVTSISPAGDASLTGQALLADVVPRQIANAHTVFNVGLALIFLPFTSQFAQIITRILPDRPEKERELVRTKFIDRVLLKTPVAAIEMAQREIERLGGKVHAIVSDARSVVIAGNRAEVDELDERDKIVNSLYAQILMYLGDVSRETLQEDQTKRVVALMGAANDLESIGDVVSELLHLAVKRIDAGVVISKPTREILEELFDSASDALELSVQAFGQRSEKLALVVAGKKAEVTALVSKAEEHQAKRLVAPEPLRLEAYTIEIDMVDRLRRIFYHAKRVAKALRPEGRRRTQAPPLSATLEAVSKTHYDPPD